jgi:hypothetical protein
MMGVSARAGRLMGMRTARIAEAKIFMMLLSEF